MSAIFSELSEHARMWVPIGLVFVGGLALAFFANRGGGGSE